MTTSSTSTSSSRAGDATVRLVSAYLADIGTYWTTTLPALTGTRLRPLGAALGYRPSDPATLPICDGSRISARAGTDNAFYCRRENVIVYDSEGLMSKLAQEYGPAVVGVLLAHEFGHAIQAQIGSQDASIRMELQADCFAGAWSAHTGRSAADDRAQRSVLRAFLDSVRGAIGSQTTGHGTGFDRVTAYVTGYRGGAVTCLPIRRFPLGTGPVPARGEAGAELNPTRDLTALNKAVVARLAATRPATAVRVLLRSNASAPLFCHGSRRTSDFVDLAMACPDDHQAVIDDLGLLPELWNQDGDLAAQYPLIRTVFQAAATQDGLNPGAVETAAECRTGAFLAELVKTPTSDLRLYSADVDEAVAGVVAYQPRRPDFAAGPPASVLQRLAELRKGYDAGVAVCTG